MLLSQQMMSAGDVSAVLERLAQAEISVWLDGGWGIDALVGEQTRAHDDLDLVVPRGDTNRAQEALRPLGYRPALDERPGLPARGSCSEQLTGAGSICTR